MRLDDSREARNTERPDPFGVAALAASGALAAHQIGYLADDRARAAHGYLTVLGPVLLLAAFVAAWSAAIRILRHQHQVAPSFALVCTLQIGTFASLEITERAIGGDAYGSLVSAPVVLGLVAQPAVAWLALRLLAVGGRLVERFASGRARHTVRTPMVHWSLSRSVLPPSMPRAALRPRGPPVG